MNSENIAIEPHPLPPFAPPHTKLLMLGSFPPPRGRWKMDFYYPNFQNDMWRIFGLVFFGDKDYFVDTAAKTFREQAIRAFLNQAGIAVGDAAAQVRRLRGNASDRFLEVVQAVDLSELLTRLPQCQTVAFTGDKAAQILLPQLGAGAKLPTIAAPVTACCAGRELTLYRLPSSSRAYPLPLLQKAQAYRKVMAAASLPLYINLR
ncbi:uracil-DNA glycosylase family protein [Conchiformibius steedae DSM 2580]|uniref:Uracil-DNA glycosylase family protein n=1 Tax=Conchiformibius steedae DSM 2580 TaxID=1121352 RepID=A0AAE9HWP5_9NEIS|nr:uracil-DNA glycosylase family protein [Conchiformibius steedae]QMT33025.1 uracil-DNA glycosylase family protein [Conchiformibius steedae]URD67650.1 uracil-DNA glycosylase family protein [Conchiformibius steedae DSM 2580]